VFYNAHVERQNVSFHNEKLTKVKLLLKVQLLVWLKLALFIVDTGYYPLDSNKQMPAHRIQCLL